MKPKTTTKKSVKIDRRWHLIDLSGQTLGRACTKIADLLIGKGKPTFSYETDNGDYVVVVNAAQVAVTGKKLRQKVYYHYTGFAGGIKSLTFGELMEKDPSEVIKHGVYGMIPKNKLRDLRIKRLKVFTGSEHPFSDKFTK